MKDTKTTIAGIIGAILVAGETLLPYFEGEGEISWFQVVSAIVILIGGYVAKDKDSDNAVADGPIGGGGIKNPPKEDDNG